jgi:hypothetical protein
MPTIYKFRYVVLDVYTGQTLATYKTFSAAKRKCRQLNLFEDAPRYRVREENTK